MSNITSDNYHELLNSEVGEPVYDIDEFSSVSSSSRPSTPHFASMDMDVDMGCGFDTLERVHFSGLGPGGIIAEKVEGPLPEYLNPAGQLATILDLETDGDWDSMISEPHLSRSATDMQQSQTHGIQLPLRDAARYKSFPCPVQTELQAAADTPLTGARSPAIAARSSTVSGGEVGFGTCTTDDDIDIDIDNDTELAAATDIMSLEPPFWNSSSSECSDEDDTTFANDGWADAVEPGLEQEWAVERQHLQELRCEEPDEHVRDWIRRGAFG